MAGTRGRAHRPTAPALQPPSVPPRSAAPGISRETLDRRLAAFEEAIGKMFGAGQMAWMRRATEAERRLLELERRVAELEGKADG